MEYLTDVWKLEMTHAATLVAIFWGLYDLLPLLQLYIAETVLGHYRMLFVFSISFSAGLGFLTMSTPPVLAHVTGNCSEYKPECIGHAQRVLLYTALPMIAFGMAVQSKWSCYETVIAERMNGVQLNVYGKAWSWLVYNIVTLIAVLGLPYIKPWSVKFGIPAICTLFATLLFSTTLCSYKRTLKPEGSPLTVFIRVFVAAASKLFYRIPKDPKELFENQDPELYSVPHTRSLRCLDKASIVEPTKPLEEQENNKWRLCRVTEVEMTKAVIRMIPVFMTLIFCGVVFAIGFTYFMAQLSHMNPKVGRLKVPTIVLVWFFKKAQMKCVDFSGDFLDMLHLTKLAPRKFASALGIVISMMLAILSCVTAAKVENRRLGVVREHGLVDKPDETVPMTMFWLLPQFLLLGAFDGVLHTTVLQFFFHESPVPMQRYLPIFVSGVSSVGVLCSVLSVFVVGKISERGGKTNWFQHGLNQSRLDKYYWTLAWLMGVNIVIFVVAAIWYRCNESKLKDEELCGFNEAIDDMPNWTYTYNICGCYNLRITKE
ncbi:hypothetical protein ABFS83_10G019200 [Erythranthe nasuta]